MKLPGNNDKEQYADIGLKTLTKMQDVGTASQQRNKVSLANADRV